MGKVFLTALLITLLPQLTLAEVKLQYGTLTDGFSKKEQTGTQEDPINESNKLVLYGGIAGLDTACDQTEGSKTCNNCNSGASTACNTRRIYDNLAIKFKFSSTTRGWPLLTTDKDADNQERIGTTIGTQTEPYAADQLIEYTVTWTDICGAMGNSDCTIAATGDSNPATFRIGIDIKEGTDISATDERLRDSEDDFITFKVQLAGATAGEITTVCIESTDADGNITSTGGTADQGICNFKVFPGDKKAYLVKALPPNNSYPSAGDNLNYETLRIYYEKATAPPEAVVTADGFNICTSSYNEFANIDFGKSKYAELNVSAGSAANVNIESPTITELDNDTAYYFRVASVDKAGNVSSFSKTGGAADDCTCPEAGDTQCHFVIPSEVFGLATDEFDCFIASAVYGSPLTPEVKIFREFRNQVLNKTKLGKFLVKTYYANSPPASKWIKQRPYIRKSMKFAFWPLMFWARSCVQNGFLLTQGGLILLLLSLSFLFRGIRSRRRLYTILLLGLFINLPADLVAKETRTINTNSPPPLEAPYTQSPAPEPESSVDVEKPEHIDEDGVYYYNTDVEDTTREYGTSDAKDDEVFYHIPTPSETINWYFRAGLMGPFEITNPVNNQTYSQIYNEGEQKQKFVFNVEFEWKVIKWLGDLGLKIGTGISVSSGGQGKFANGANSALTPLETYDLYIFPNSAVITYHFRLGETPWFVPYIQGGGGYYTFWERRTDNKSNKFGGAPVLDVGGGLLISLSSFDQDTALTFYNDYGITRLWLDIQYRQIIAADDIKQFSSNTITAGFGLGF